MRTTPLLLTFGLTFVAILALNAIIRTVRHGFDATLSFPWQGIAIAAGIAVLVTLSQVDQRK